MAAVGDVRKSMTQSSTAADLQFAMDGITDTHKDQLNQDLLKFLRE
jgi:hypothetical protein